ncbi:membrane protein insertion efficiency factor YidD [Streptomyces sp. NPDC050504]|uniref:membrane protein insertion efficiency factor YidD n=1 Tax=Streptomyces sp. NPDC050504 TaxID=3365618 RepID=UPI0037A0F587
MARKAARGGRYEEPRRRKRDDEEGCCTGALDTYIGCGRCCPALALSSLALPVFSSLSGLVRPAGATREEEDPVAPRPAGRTAAALYAGVRRYRVAVSPGRAPCCPYTPSCSTYAIRALHRHGAARGGLLILRRLARCRPGAARRRGFSDPVPD